MEAVGQRIKELRNKLEITQSELTKKLGLKNEELCLLLMY